VVSGVLCHDAALAPRPAGRLNRAGGYLQVLNPPLTSRSCAVACLLNLSLSVQGFDSRFEVPKQELHRAASTQQLSTGGAGSSAGPDEQQEAACVLSAASCCSTTASRLLYQWQPETHGGLSHALVSAAQQGDALVACCLPQALLCSVEETQHLMGCFQQQTLPHQQWARERSLQCTVAKCVAPSLRPKPALPPHARRRRGAHGLARLEQTYSWGRIAFRA